MKKAIILALCLALVSLGVALAEDGGHGGKGFVELKAFHDVMAKMWHEDFPKDDWKAIRTATPQLKKATDALVAAKLPASYQPRAAQFEVDVKLLAASVENVIKAGNGADDGALKQAVIKMHEAFHDVAYNLNRKALPDEAEPTDPPEDK